MKTSDAHNERMATMTFASVSPLSRQSGKEGQDQRRAAPGH